MWVTPGGQKWPLGGHSCSQKGPRAAYLQKGQSLLSSGNPQVTCPVSWKFLAVETFLRITNLFLLIQLLSTRTEGLWTH